MGLGRVIVAGHICLDILPAFPPASASSPFSFTSQFQPGSLLRVGPAVFSTGGPVSNTGLALHNMPTLEPTNIVEGREPRVWKMAPGPNRKRDRSKTYEGIADAIVTQWGPIFARDTRLCSSWQEAYRASL